MFDTNFGFQSMKATLLVTSQHHVLVLVLFFVFEKNPGTLLPSYFLFFIY